MYRSSRLNTKVLQQSHTTRGTGTCEAPGPCQAGTRDLCYLRLVSRSQTAIFSFILGREKKFSRPNINEKIAVWLHETNLRRSYLIIIIIAVSW